MRGKDGHTLTMLSCPRCESRTWFADGEPVERTDVLKLSAGNPDFVMSPSPGRGSPRR